MSKPKPKTNEQSGIDERKLSGETQLPANGVVESATLPDRVISAVSETDEPENPVAATAQNTAAKKRKSTSALSAESRNRNKNTENGDLLKHERSTISAIPYGEEKRSLIPIFEREATQLKADEDLSSRTDAASIYATLKTYMSSARSIPGKIAGVAVFDSVPCWAIFQGKVTIYIPFNESYMTVPKNLTGPMTPEKHRNQTNFLAQSIGLEIEFVLTSLRRDPENEDRFIATASRTTDLARKRLNYFSGDLIRAGADIVCRVISSNKWEMFITVAGLDIRVPRNRVTYRPVVDLSELYPVNSLITMRIVDVKPGSATELPELMLSAKPIEKLRIKPNAARLRPGNRFHATISSVNDGRQDPNEAGRVSLWLDDVEYIATSKLNLETTERPLEQGTVVLYEHIGFTAQDWSHGKILRIIKYS